MELQCHSSELSVHQFPEVLLLLHGLFIIFGGIILTAQCVFKLKHQTPTDKRLLRYHGHIARWAGTAVLLVLQTFTVIYGVLTAHRSDSLYNWILYLPFIISLFGTVFSVVYCHYAESTANPKALLFAMLYWVSAFVIQCLQFVGYITHSENITNYIEFHLNWTTMCVYLALTFTEIYVIIKEGYLSRTYQPTCVPEDVSDMTYIHPYTSFLSQTTWHWISNFLHHGYKHTLQLEDLGVLPQSESVCHNYALFQKAFLKEKERSGGVREKASLWRCIFEVCWPMVTLAGVYKLLSDCLLFVAPVCLDYMVSYVADSLEQPDNTTAVAGNDINQGNNQTYHCGGLLTVGDYFSNGYVLAVVVLLAGLTQATLYQNNFYLACRQGVRCKGALQALVYNKTLGLSTQGMTEGGTTQGQILNHMSVDPLNIYMFFFLGHFGWTLPIQVLIGFVLLYAKLGVSALISGMLIVLMVPVQYFVGSRLARVQKKMMVHADERLKKCNEVLQSIKLLKLYAWEAVFTKSITETRKQELKLLLKAGLLRVVSISICDGAPVAAALITFSLYPYLEKKPLEAGKVFSGLALFAILSIPLFLITMVMNGMAHAMVSARRLRDFLFAEDVEVAETNDGEPSGIEKHQLGEHKNGGHLKLEEKDHLISHDTPHLNHLLVDDLPPVKVKTVRENSVCSPHSAELSENGTNQNASGTDSGQTPGPVLNEGVAVEVKNGSFCWDIKSQKPVIKDLELQIKKGEFTMILGPVGSGKSSLLLALLGEMTTLTGTVTWQQDVKIAYVPQKAWITNATLQSNILFGKEMDPEAYSRVLDVCALKADIDLLVAGDRTEIGEKGINLSGGQKQRVSIARALYAGANVVILDDPLSALDAHVGQHVMEEAILKSMLANDITVILATHQLHFLSHAHKVLVLSDGQVTEQGGYKQIMLKVPALSQILEKSAPSQTDSDGVQTTQSRDTAAKYHDLTHGCPSLSGSPSPLTPLIPGVVRSAISLASLTYIEPELGEFKAAGETHQTSAELGRLIEVEERATGAVPLTVYLHYLKAGTLWLSLGAIALYALRQVMRIVTDFWLAHWADVSQQAAAQGSLSNNSQGNSSDLDNPEYQINYDVPYYMSIYGVYTGISMVLCAVSILCLEFMAVVAARNLFRRMLVKIVRAPMRFFDTTPIGRIINRFASDTNMIDEKMAVSWDQVLFCLVYVLGGVGVNAVTTPYFILPAVVIFILYLAIQRFYIASSRELHRLDNITKSPVLAHFSETLGGLTSIRAYREQKRFEETTWKYIEDNNAACLFRETANVWMGIRLDYLGAMVVFSAATSSITTGLYGHITPAVVGLSIAYAVMISSFINWLMRGISELEMWFNAVERVLHYTDIESEPQTEKQTSFSLPPDWPETGDIHFNNVSLRYDASLPCVAQNVDVHIQSGQKVGICGRTGSGKSSLSLSLFRLVEICEGQIQVDGQDIRSVPLDRLRASLSIIPQDPVLFSGSVRYNLDPGETKSDEEIWHAIEIAQLKDTIFSLPQKLDSQVTEGGENFSIGQRQLFCLARAFLRHSPVIIMDEATASIDFKTDLVIQQVIQNAFKDSTVLIIAHRIHTILKCDEIIVLQDGRVLEHDTPSALSARAGSLFSSMVEQNKI